MKIGFTGTQKGMSKDQKRALIFFISSPGIEEFHHGDCNGADEQAHNIVKGTDIKIHVHPPKNPKKRSFCRDYSVIYEKKEYLDRNHSIVDMTDILLAMPSGKEEEIRSGTWATIRYARKVGKKCLIIFPDGSMKGEKN